MSNRACGPYPQKRYGRPRQSLAKQYQHNVPAPQAPLPLTDTRQSPKEPLSKPRDANRQFGEASDKQIAGALGVARELDRFETTQRLLPQDTQLHFS